MRDPIERSLSNYFYAYSYEEHRYRQLILDGRLSFEDFLILNSHEISNSQTYLLAGPYASETLRGTALENLANGFCAVGISELFDESLIYISKVLGWNPPFYLRKNVSHLDAELAGERRRLSALHREKSAGLLSDDFAVYEAARGRLVAWIDDQGNAFNRALEAFREIQLHLSKHEDHMIFDEYTFEQDDPLQIFLSPFIGSEPYRIVESYLKESLPVTRPPHNYVGYIDHSNDGFVSGWAINLSSGQPISVSVCDGDFELGNVVCGLVREDVAKAGYPRAEVGFSARIGLIADPKRISIYFESSKLRLRSNL
jgi:hypothetical protein